MMTAEERSRNSTGSAGQHEDTAARAPYLELCRECWADFDGLAKYTCMHIYIYV